MFNASISSSSSHGENAAIPKTRIQRHNKWHVQVTNKSEEKNLNLLCDESSGSSEEEIGLKTSKRSIGVRQTQLLDNSLDIFHEESLMAVADRHSLVSHSQNRQSEELFSQEFHKSADLDNEIAFTPKVLMIPSAQSTPFLSVNDIHIPDLDTHSEITESELLSICEKAEMQESTLKTLDQKVNESPEKDGSKSIIKKILEDFCSSPISPNCSPQNTEVTPVFHFKGKPLRTYSRKSTSFVRKNFTEELSKAMHSPAKSPMQDDDCLSCSSGLSVQEDLTPVQLINAIANIELNNSQRLCENLLNLSAFFTQNVHDSKAEPQSKEQQVQNVNLFEEEETNILKHEAESDKELLELDLNEIEPSQSDYTNGNTAKSREQLHPNKTKQEISGSSDDFEGFADVLRGLPTKIRCSSSCSVDFVGFANTTTEVELQQLADNCNGRQKIYFDFLPSRGVIMKVKECDDPPKCSEASDEEPAKALKEECSICSADEAEWNDDCDIFLNFNTQAALNKANVNRKMETESNNFVGFQTASHKSIVISKEALDRAGRILQDLPQILGSSQYSIAKCKASNVNSRKTKTTDIDLDVGNLDLDHWDFEGETAVNSSNERFVGFKTASKKEIYISEAAKAKAVDLMTELPALPLRTEINTSKRLNHFVGFQTASKKCITVSEGAKARAATLIANLPDLPGVQKRDLQCEEEGHSNGENFTTMVPTMLPYLQNVNGSESNCSSGNNFKSFQTASGKVIAISKEANAKAASILAQLPELAMQVPSKAALVDTQPDKVSREIAEYMNIELSEWPLSQTVKHDADHKRDQSNKRKLLLDTDSSLTPKQEAKIVCISQKTGETLSRTPLNRIENGIQKASPSDLSEGSSMNTSKKSTLISRRNLLSLSKRRKQKSGRYALKSTNGSEYSIRNETLEQTVDNPPASAVIPEFRTPDPQKLDAVLTRSVRTTCDTLSSLAPPSEAVKANEGLIPIDWGHQDATSKTASVVSRSVSDTSGSAKKQAVLSPQQRIELLCTYENPPPLSPIGLVTTTKVRALGLRRRKSSLKSMPSI